MSVHFALEDKTEQIKLILRKTVETKQKYIPTDSEKEDFVLMKNHDVYLSGDD